MCIEYEIKKVQDSYSDAMRKMLAMRNAITEQEITDNFYACNRALAEMFYSMLRLRSPLPPSDTAQNSA